MAARDIDPNARALPVVGEHVCVTQGMTIPERCLQRDSLVCMPGAQASVFRVVQVNPAPTPSGWQTGTPNPEDVIVLSNTTQQGRRNYTRAELEAIRPLGFVVMDRAWRRLARFVEGGIYQVWPTGQVFRVRNRHLVDAYTDRRINPETERHRLPPIVMWCVPRWLPPVAPAATTPPDEEE